MSVTVLERDTARARHLARGRRACSRRSPRSSSAAGGRRLLELGLRSAQMWPRVRRGAARQRRASMCGLLRTGTLLLARDEDEARELERQLEFRRSLGLRVTRLRPSEAREREPALAPTMRLALEAPDDHSVDPRAVLAALRARVRRPPAWQLREHASVARVELDGGGRARRGRDARRRRARGGASTSCSRPAPGAGASTGCRRRARAGAPGQGPDPAPARPRRAGPAAPRGALPRRLPACRAATAATCSARPSRSAASSWRRPPAASTSCCATPTSWCPGISELEIEELSVGLRPGTPDNAPAIGPGAVPRA